MSNYRTILAIDTAHPLYSIAIINSNDVFLEISTKEDEKPSEEIIELLDNSLLQANLGMHDIDCIAVGVGPGNFTGIRVGISFAKGIAFALNIKCFGINRFQTLIDTDLPTLGIISVRENLFYTQMFTKKKPISDPVEENLLKILNTKYAKDTIISGDHALKISQKLGLNYGKETSISKASELGLCLKYSDSNGLMPSPIYLKEPAAFVRTSFSTPKSLRIFIGVLIVSAFPFS